MLPRLPGRVVGIFVRGRGGAIDPAASPGAKATRWERAPARARNARAAAQPRAAQTRESVMLAWVDDFAGGQKSIGTLVGLYSAPALRGVRFQNALRPSPLTYRHPTFTGAAFAPLTPKNSATNIPTTTVAPQAHCSRIGPQRGRTGGGFYPRRTSLPFRLTERAGTCSRWVTRTSWSAPAPQSLPRTRRCRSRSLGSRGGRNTHQIEGLPGTSARRA
jgi:hypothetical protein